MLNHESIGLGLLNMGSAHRKNWEGYTVLDILERQTLTQVDNQRIRDMLRQRCVGRCTAKLEHYN
jgi:hypothetical protein